MIPRRWLWSLLVTAAGHVARAMSVADQRNLANEVREMFDHAFLSYMQHGFPADELRPVDCTGRFRGIKDDRGDADNAMGGFPLTLIESLSTLAVLGEYDAFMYGVDLVAARTNFNNDFIVSVFEITIRTLGGLLSAHVLAEEITRKMTLKGKHRPYDGSLLILAEDLGVRLLPAFNTPTGIPMIRVNLKHGALSNDDKNVCVACAGTLLLEFGALSRLTGKPVFEEKARHALDQLYRGRSKWDMVPRLYNTQSGNTTRDCYIGAGVDSYYEYLLKAHIVEGNATLLDMFEKHYTAIQAHSRRGSFHVEVDCEEPQIMFKPQMDSLMAFWPGLQALYGDVAGAMETWELLRALATRHHGLIPEVYNRDLSTRDLHYYLRPEFAESTYMLYKATGDVRYLEAGRDMVKTIQAKTKCGYTALSDIHTGKTDDRMDSFFLAGMSILLPITSLYPIIPAETLKYLFLLFAEKEDVGVDLMKYEFNTEAHLMPIADSTQQRVSRGTCQRFDYLHNALVGSLPHHGVRMSAAAQNDVDLFVASFDAPTTVWNFDIIRYMEHMGVWTVPSDNGRFSIMTVDGLAVNGPSAETGKALVQQLKAVWESKPQIVDEKMRTLEVVEPSGAKAKYEAMGAEFGFDLFSNGPASGKLIEAQPLNACEVLDQDKIKGFMVLVMRGGCSFATKARNAQRAQAIGMVVFDNEEGKTIIMAADEDMAHDPVHIPALMVSRAHGHALRVMIADSRGQGLDVVMGAA